MLYALRHVRFKICNPTYHVHLTLGHVKHDVIIVLSPVGTCTGLRVLVAYTLRWTSVDPREIRTHGSSVGSFVRTAAPKCFLGNYAVGPAENEWCNYWNIVVRHGLCMKPLLVGPPLHARGGHSALFEIIVKTRQIMMDRRR